MHKPDLPRRLPLPDYQRLRHPYADLEELRQDGALQYSLGWNRWEDKEFWWKATLHEETVRVTRSVRQWIYSGSQAADQHIPLGMEQVGEEPVSIAIQGEPIDGRIRTYEIAAEAKIEEGDDLTALIKAESVITPPSAVVYAKAYSPPATSPPAGLVKVGATLDIVNRSIIGPHELLATSPGYMWLEHAFHRQVRHLRVEHTQEVFRMDALVADLILSMKTQWWRESSDAAQVEFLRSYLWNVTAA